MLRDGEEKGDLRSRRKGVVTLAGQFVEFWNGLLPFDPANITTNYVAGEEWTEIQITNLSCSENQQNIITVITNLARKKKLLQLNSKKAEVGKYSAF